MKITEQSEKTVNCAMSASAAHTVTASTSNGTAYSGGIRQANGFHYPLQQSLPHCLKTGWPFLVPAKLINSCLVTRNWLVVHINHIAQTARTQSMPMGLLSGSWIGEATCSVTTWAQNGADSTLGI